MCGVAGKMSAGILIGSRGGCGNPCQCQLWCQESAKDCQAWHLHGGTCTLAGSAEMKRSNDDSMVGGYVYENSKHSTWGVLQSSFSGGEHSKGNDKLCLDARQFNRRIPNASDDSAGSESESEAEGTVRQRPQPTGFLEIAAAEMNGLAADAAETAASSAFLDILSSTRGGQAQQRPPNRTNTSSDPEIGDMTIVGAVTGSATLSVAVNSAAALAAVFVVGAFH